MPHRLVTVGYLGLVLAGGWAVNYASEARSTQKLVTLQNACEHVGNPGRALNRIGTRGHLLSLRERFQPIVDCHRMYFENNGEPVPLPLAQQRLYVDWIRGGVLPVIHADGTVAPR